jgi:hypothetical protein
MVLAIGVIIFVIGCCLSSYEDTSYQAQRNAERRKEEIIAQLNKLHESRELAPRTERRARRRIAKDKEGNILAEEETEEIIR